MESVLVPDRAAEATITRLMTDYGDHILRLCDAARPLYGRGSHAGYLCKGI